VATIDAGTILFPSGNTRLSTILLFAAFIALALTRRSWLPAIACAFWLCAFEVALDVTELALGRRATLDWIHLSFYSVVAIALPVWLARRGVKPSLTLGIAVLSAWGIWIGTGFHVNEHSMTGFDPAAEALNEAAKTAWAAAYLWPLWKLIAKESPAASPAAASGRLGEAYQPLGGTLAGETDAAYVVDEAER